MAGRALTPVGMIAKWIIVPAALVVGGFYLLGPRFGKVMPSLGGGSDVQVTPVADTNDRKPTYAAPDVDVNQKPALQAPEVQVTAKHAKHRRKRQHPVVTDDENAREPVDDYLAPSDNKAPGAKMGPK